MLPRPVVKVPRPRPVVKVAVKVVRRPKVVKVAVKVVRPIPKVVNLHRHPQPKNPKVVLCPKKRSRKAMRSKV